MANNIRIPPPPLTTEDKTVWSGWYMKIKDAINSLGQSFFWSSLNFTGSNITDILTRNHNDLKNMNGGTTGQYYHLTSAEYSGLTTKITGTQSISFSSIAANTTGSTTMTLTGAQTGQVVILGAPSGLETDLVFCGYVSAANTITIRIHNSRGTSVTPATATWRATVLL